MNLHLPSITEQPPLPRNHARYDAAGNLTSNPGVGTYTYNAENQLVSTAGVTYTYDGDGKRVMKSGGLPAGAGAIYWYGSGSDPLQQTDLTGASVYSHYYFNGQRIALFQLTAQVRL